MNPQNCQSIILSTLNFGESDRIVSIFTLEHGQIRAIAKGARASRKRFGGLLEPPNRLDLMISMKEEGLSRIEKVERAAFHSELRNSLESMALALYVCELVRSVTPEGHPFPRLFRLLSALLEYISLNIATTADRYFFEINLLNILGYRPLMDEKLLNPLVNCLKTGTFGKVVFNSYELIAAGQLLNREIDGLCSHSLKSRTFLENLI